MNKTGEINCGNLLESAKATAEKKKLYMYIVLFLSNSFLSKFLPFWCENSFVVPIILSFGVYLEYPMSHQL